MQGRGWGQWKEKVQEGLFINRLLKNSVKEGPLGFTSSELCYLRQHLNPLWMLRGLMGMPCENSPV